MREYAHFIREVHAVEIPGIERKIRIVAAVRFPYLLFVLGIGNPELTPVRVDHTMETLKKLLSQVKSLEIKERF